LFFLALSSSSRGILAAVLSFWSIAAGRIAKGGSHESARTQYGIAVLALLGAIGVITSVPFLSIYAVWLALIGYVVLAVGTLVEM